MMLIFFFFFWVGLTTEEKDLVADAYDCGVIKIICCTATMAAGVNLPARRVIISPRMGRDFVSPAMLYVSLPRYFWSLY